MPSDPYYWPKGWPAQLVFMLIFLKGIGDVGMVLGLTLLEIAAIQEDLRFYIWHVQVCYPAMELFNSEMAKYHELMTRGGTGLQAILVRPTPPVFTDTPEMRPAGVLKRFFSVVNRIMHEEAFNEDIAKLLNLQRPVAAPGKEHPYPQINPSLVEGNGRKRVRLDFKKFKHDGIIIRCRRNNGEWEILEVDNSSPHYDDRPLLVENMPETREYSARFWDKGEANGEWSPGVIISVVP